MILRIFSISAAVGFGVVQADDFQDLAQQSINTNFKAAAAEAEKLVAEDKLDAANQVYLRAVPDEKLTPIDCFVLGNTFFKTEDALSLKYHRRALEALPEEPLINLEWAMGLHRAGRYSEAIAGYQKCIEAMPGRHLPHTLVADCLLRTDRLKEAVEHWKLADHPHNHTGIDFAIYEIYGAASPFKRRNNLLKAVNEGQTAKMDELMALSAVWDTDWWNAEPNRRLLKRDLDIAKKVLSKEPEHLEELELYAKTYTEEEITSEWLKKQLEPTGWIIGENGRLPTSGHVADRLVALALEHQLVDAKTLLSRFEKELRRRSLDDGGQDLMALNMLAHLLAAAAGEERGADLAAVDQAGWNRYHDPRFAASFLVGELDRGNLKTDSPAFMQAMKDFPEDEFICLLGLQMAQEESRPMLQPLLAAMKAEFRHLSNSSGVIKDSYKLKALFGMLEKELEKTEK